MPALTMRGRYIMREYWSDSDLFLRLDATTREVYIGLWMLADDAGWMPRDVPAIAASLYRYEDRAPREEIVRKALDRLRDLGKVESFRCCLYLDAVSRYPRSGQKSNIFEVEHLTHEGKSKRVKDVRPSSTPSPVPSLPDPSLRSAPAPEPDGTGGAGSLKDRVGWQPPADVARRAS